MSDPKKIVTFLRQKDFEFIRELGEGACGKTVLLHDPLIEQTFVCKKYSPRYERHKAELFENFKREIRILYLINHTNVVRVFNFHLYPAQLTGFIVMEFVDGYEIDQYVANNPEKIDEVFVQTVEGFAYLERNEVLHRDIRPRNILVSKDGVVKIIDFGFGKRIASKGDFDKSISLNWWCEPPRDFANGTYDYATEVYFVGKLFEKLIAEQRIDDFAYAHLLERMCTADHDERVQSFVKIRQELLSGEYAGVVFDEWEKEVYRAFADRCVAALSEIERSTKYFSDVAEIERKLMAVHEKVQLEDYVPSSNLVLRCLIDGTYTYHRGGRIPVEALEQFISLMKGSSRQRKQIILNNLFTRFDTVKRYDIGPPDFDDDIPF